MNRSCKWMVAAVVAGGASSAFANNLVVNPNFTTDANGWTAAPDTNLPWTSTHDANSAPDSGAMTIVTANGSNSQLAAQQCISGVSGGSDFSFGAQVLPQAASEFGMTCTAFASSDCLGAPIGSASAVVAGPANGAGWVPLHSESPFLLPASTLGVSCALTATQPLRAAGANSPQGFSPAVFADNVFFGLGTTPVSLQSFDVE